MTDAIDRLTEAMADRYVIQEELGAGGMATVYLAQDVKHNRKVAVKVLRPELAAVLGADRFLKEIEVTANLQHPHILPLFDSGQADGFLFYVMPFVAGESLRETLDRVKQLAVDEALEVTRAVASALDYAHRQNIIHRDIKPENVLLHDGQALVADFGIALAVSAAGGGRMTETGLSLGTPHYMSPEQATADRELDARSDVYSLACVTYEMLAGEPPHLGNNAQAIIAKILTDPARPICELRATVPAHIEAVLAKALQKLPADRFAGAKEFAEALADPRSAALAATVTTIPGVSSAGRGWSAGGPRLAAVVAGTLALGVAAGWMMRPLPRIERASVRFAHYPDSTHTLFSECCGAPVAISRDGRRIAYEGGSAGNTNQLFVRPIDEVQGHALPGTDGARNLFWSPDGEWVGFVAAGALMKSSVAGGTPVKIADFAGDGQGATWTTDGEIIFARQPGTGLYRVSADGGVPELLTSPDSAAGEVAHRTPHYVPEAHAVLYAVWPRSGDVSEARIAQLDLASGASRTVGVGLAPSYAQGHLVYAVGGGAIMAQPYDPARGETLGSPIRIADGAMVRPDGTVEYGVSSTGTLAMYDWWLAGETTLQLLLDGVIQRSIPFPIPGADHLDGPRFSPDGRRVVVAANLASRHQLFMLDLDAGTTQRFTFDGESQYKAWTTRGDSVVYSLTGTGVMIRAADGSADPRVVVPIPSGEPQGISVHGPWVTFGIAVNDRSDVLVAHRDSSGPPRAYAATGFAEGQPAISPDGRWLAYVSNETGREEVYVGAFPTPAGRVVVSNNGGTEPAWSADGRTIYYRDYGTSSFVAVHVETRETVAVIARETVFRISAAISVNDREYDVRGTDGTFVIVSGDAGQDVGILVVTEALERR